MRGVWLITWIWAAIWIVMAVKPVKAAPVREYRLGVQIQRQGYLAAEIKRIIDTFLKTMEKRSGHKFRLELYREFDELKKGLNTGKLDVVFTMGFPDEVLLNYPQYQPFLTMTIFDRSEFSACFYQPAGAQAKGLEGLRGRRMLTMDNPVIYYLLQEMLGQTKPTAYFKFQKLAANGQSSLYALSLGQTDTAFAYEYNINFMKLINPGPLKKIKPVVCSKTKVPAPPLFVHKKAPKSLIELLIKTGISVREDPSFGHFHGLMKRFGIRWERVSANSANQLSQWLKQAAASGWTDEFRRTRSLTGSANM